MAVQQQGFDLPMQVSANSAGIEQFRAVVLDVAGGSGPFDCIRASSTAAPIIGINQTMGGPPAVGVTTPPVATAGQTIDVRQFGYTKAEAGGAITTGQFVAVDANGRFVALANLVGGATDTYAVGVALTPATAAGDYFTLLLMPGLMTQVTA